ncbi:hypothetical protein [Rhodanobacter sp. L36]|uniref:hypothetical protein n=1 Tax=Rhodanobacter sp. L36 TaxID=1747221 RepID=UPI00131B2774|nr:hypothetical protein [Rhodanobacter sp. L36]
MATETILTTARASLERVQNFEPKELARTLDLGRQLNFEEIVEPAERLVALYKRISLVTLNDLVDSQLQQIGSQADADFNRFKEILNFSADQSNASGVRATLISQMLKAYEATFPVLWQYIAYGVATATDASVIEGRARSVLQSIEDKAEKLSESLADRDNEAQQILVHIQQVAAEHGVSQQAQYFKDRADEHSASSDNWRTATGVSVAITIIFAVLSAFAFKLDWMKAISSWDAAEFISGKILVFVTLAAVVALCAKNFLAHQHNAILNRHRQTALQTYKVLVDAGASGGSQDIVLAYAAACIFGAQETGFAKDSGEGAGKSVLELMTKSVVSGTKA